MNDTSQVYRQLWRQLHENSDIDSMLASLRELEEMQESKQLSVKDRYGLQVVGFRRLRDLVAETPSAAEPLILQHLLPACLETHPDASVELHQHRECLAQWLDQYPDEAVRFELRNKVLDAVLPFLGSPEPLPACSVVSQIGYRNGEIVESLWDIVERDDNRTGDVALATLTALGVPIDQRESILTELHKRAAARYNLSLVSALVWLADPTSVQVAHDAWLVSDEYKLQAFDKSLVFNAYRAVLDAKSDDHALQDQIWQLLVGLVDQRPDQFSREFSLGQTAPVCNSILVVPKMLEWLGKDTENGESSWEHYLTGLRLEECVRPRQLEGWESLDETPAFELLRHDACHDTGTDGFWTTREDMVKKKAWETLLRAGYAGGLEWFDEAVLSETGRFLQKSIIEWFALFRFDSLPATINKWITEEIDESFSNKDSREFMRRAAATRMARSSASREAFNMLANFGSTHDGKAMMHSVYALAEVALYLVRKGDESIVDELVQIVVHRTEEHQRTAAAYAIEHIASTFPSAVLKYTEQLVPILYDFKREPYERGTLLNALAHLEDWEIPDKILQDMKTWAHRPDKWEGGGSLAVLARRGYLHNDYRLLTEVLSLRQIDEKWDIIANTERFEWAPYSIGLLYYHHPDLFAPAIASLIRELEWFSAPQIFEWLDYLHSGRSQPALAEEIKDALVQRIHDKQLGAYSEAETFYVLGKLAPTKLVEEQWQDEWERWLPDSRVALANALGEARVDSDLLSRATHQLELLAGDGQVAVRRAAYRGLARQSMDALYRFCLSRSDPEASTVELRRRAAEACGWLDHVTDTDGKDSVSVLYHQLVTDQEKVVRDAAQRAWEEQRQRVWTNRYSSVVTGVKGQTNQEILDAWRYGAALVRIGDDSCIEILREHLGSNSHPPNVRYWIQQIIEDMQETWRKTTQKWPEPWFAWKGAIEEGRGKIHNLRKEAVEINYSIWSQPRAAPSEPPRFTWGGAIWPVPLHILDVDDGVIELETGRRGKINLTGTTGETATFLGSGPYPTC